MSTVDIFPAVFKIFSKMQLLRPLAIISLFPLKKCSEYKTTSALRVNHFGSYVTPVVLTATAQKQLRHILVGIILF